MKEEARKTALTAVGAVVGAGFASGMEIDSFFARYGIWSFAGIGAAASAVWLLGMGALRSAGPDGMPRAWQGGAMGRLWRACFALLMLTTGGAMLAGAGEIAALLLPVRHASAIGTALTAILAWILTGRGQTGMAGISRALVILLLGLSAAGFLLPAQKGAVISFAKPWEAVIRGAAWSGFNMALAVPVLAGSAGRLSLRERRKCAAVLTAVLTTLLLGGDLLLLRHSGLCGEAMPMLRLMAGFGLAGYTLAGVCMYLAVLTTCCASLQGIRTLLPGRETLCLCGMLLCAMLGFSAVVEKVYPVLGAACLGLMTAAFFR
ncbi:MAG: hypothetical protein IJ507_08070 [Clostridia bacterium]|nr:hypothetical protein [Clostridia bacterium]